MDINSKLALADAIYWTKLIDQHLDTLKAFADDLGRKLDESTDLAVYSLSIDAHKISTKATGIKSRNQHVLEDLIRLEAESSTATT